MIRRLSLILAMSACLPASAAADKSWPGRLRGLCLGHTTEETATEACFQRMGDWKVNVVTINFSVDAVTGIEDASATPPVPHEMDVYRGGLQRLDRILELARDHGIHVVLVAGAIEGRDRLNVWKPGESGENTETFIDNLSLFWRFMAARYRDNPTVLAYDLLGEPHAKSVVPVWRSRIAPRLVREIRALDPDTWILFQPGPWGMPNGYAGLEPLVDPRPGEGRIGYVFHMYAPHNYTHQGIGTRPRGVRYPGMLKMFPGSPVKLWDRAALAEYMRPALEFKRRYDVRMYVGEFSAVRWAPGRAQWVEDVISLLEQHGVDWAFHSYTGWNGWNPTFPPDAKGSKEPDGGYESEQLKVLRKWWTRNEGPPAAGGDR